MEPCVDPTDRCASWDTSPDAHACATVSLPGSAGMADVSLELDQGHLVLETGTVPDGYHLRCATSVPVGIGAPAGVPQQSYSIAVMCKRTPMAASMSSICHTCGCVALYICGYIPLYLGCTFPPINVINFGHIREPARQGYIPTVSRRTC
eukprot:9480738-Pyramimonas_sp.AAC.1